MNKIEQAASADQEISDPTTGSKDSRRKLLIWVFVALCLVLFAYWVYQRYVHVSTNDARIAADLIAVSSRVPGRIAALNVSQDDVLKRGDLIAVIDDREARFHLRELEQQLQSMQASYERAVAEIKMVDQQTAGHLQVARSQLNAAKAGLAATNSSLELSASEWQRSQSLRKKQIISQQQWETARNANQGSLREQQRAQADVDAAQAVLVEARAAQTRLQVLDHDLARLQHDKERVSIQLERQRVNVEDRTVVSPLGGIVDKVFVNAGEYVSPGQRLVLVHNPEEVWVSANIKETEVRHIEKGDAVSITVDAYPRRKFTGEVVRIGSAATSQFSLLPSTNPSGNFTKMTQRLPVKIAVDQTQGLLKPGMMVEVSIDIR